MTQSSKPKVLQDGKGVARLSTRQIKTICIRNGWTCQMSKVPANEILVDRRIVCDPRYRKSNAVMVAKSAGGRVWLCLGWRWDVEELNEAQIVELLKGLEALALDKEEQSWQQIIAKPHVHRAIVRLAEEARSDETEEGGFDGEVLA